MCTVTCWHAKRGRALTFGPLTSPSGPISINALVPQRTRTLASPPLRLLFQCCVLALPPRVGAAMPSVTCTLPVGTWYLTGDLIGSVTGPHHSG